MKVTKVLLRKNSSDNGLKFFANVEFDKTLIINGFKIFARKTDGTLFVMPPSQQGKNGQSYPLIWMRKDGEELSPEADVLREEINEKLITAAHEYTVDFDVEDPRL